MIIARFLVVATFICPFSAQAVDSQRVISQRWAKTESYGTTENVHKIIRTRFPDYELVVNPELEAQVRRDLTLVYGKYRELFPHLMANKAFPDFVLFESTGWSDVQTYVPFVGNGESRRVVVMIPTALFSPGQVPYQAKIGVLAHELAHGFLLHNYIDEAVVSVRHKDGKTPLSNEVYEAVERYLFYASIAGPFPNDELGGFPFGQGILFDVLKKHLSGSACRTRIVKFFEDFHAKSQANFSNSRFDFHFSTDQSSQEMRESLLRLKSETLACDKETAYVGNNLKLQRFPSGGALSVTSERFINFYLDKDFKWQDQNEFDVLLRLSQALHAEMRSLAKKHDLDSVRWRSFEDEADEFGITIMKSLGLDPKEFGIGIANVFGQGEGFAQKCLADIQAGREIPYGYIGSAHHAPCYRLSRMFKLRADPNFFAKP